MKDLKGISDGVCKSACPKKKKKKDFFPQGHLSWLLRLFEWTILIGHQMDSYLKVRYIGTLQFKFFLFTNHDKITHINKSFLYVRS